MSIPIRVLIVEDSEDDMLLILHELRKGGYDPDFVQVDNHNSMEDALSEQQWDVIIADYAMPEFDGIKALKLLEEKGHDIPFILVSGTIGEEVAVSAMKSGADDYVMKNKLARLVPAIKRELNEFEDRRILRRVEKELQESEKHHRKLLNTLKEGVYQCEPHNEGVFTWVNQACAEIFGYSSPKEMIGTKIKNIYVNPEDRELLLKKLEKNEVWKNFESICKRANGEQIYTERTSNMIRDEKGNPDCIEGVIRDITERKKMEETIRKHHDELESLVEERTSRILELERQRMDSEKLAASGRMAASVAHEINNPLSSIKGGFLLIKDAIAKDYKYYEYVGIIDKEIDRITRITRQLFNLNRPYQGEISNFDFTTTVSEVISMLRELGNKHGVSINHISNNGAVTVAMSEDYLRQILYNIVKNSIEASSEGEKVDVFVNNLNDRMTVIVSDQGKGMSEKLRLKIFDPFFTTKNKNSDSGLGLGLSTTKIIAESMGGTVECISEEGKGTDFIIDLPVSFIADKK